MEPKIVDARGLPCPQPVLKTKEALEQINKGEKIIVIVDNESARENIKKFLAFQGHKVLQITSKGRDIFIEVEKAGDSAYHAHGVSMSCKISSPSVSKPFLVITNCILGPEEELGEILMKGFLETMLVQELLPEGMFFMNRGIFLTTRKEDFISIIKQFEQKGVEIYTCGTCLKFFNLEEELKVGKRAGTDVYLEAVFSKNTIWIG